MFLDARINEMSIPHKKKTKKKKHENNDQKKKKKLFLLAYYLLSEPVTEKSGVRFSF